MVPPEKRSLSMVFQSYAVWPHKTVFENLAYGLRLRRLDGKTIAAKVAEALATVRMEPYAARYPSELSGGQQQRVAVARALVLEPEILLFDEPLSNLDATLREHMRFEIKALLGKLKITAIYVTHDQNEAMVIADRVAVMNRGTDRADRLARGCLLPLENGLRRAVHRPRQCARRRGDRRRGAGPRQGADRAASASLSRRSTVAQRAGAAGAPAWCGRSRWSSRRRRRPA